MCVRADILLHFLQCSQPIYRLFSFCIIFITAQGDNFGYYYFLLIHSPDQTCSKVASPRASLRSDLLRYISFQGGGVKPS